MPHKRTRHIIFQLLKKLKSSRVVSLQGARQVGKSYLARELLREKLPTSGYVTLDKQQPRDFAHSNPETFIESFDSRPLIIDETQKAPPLFDAIKWKVDEDPKPGQYLLLGSTEFSKELRIRESLTGRLSRARLYSMNLSEAVGKQPKHKNSALLSNISAFERKGLLRHFEKGGFPGIFSIHDTGLFKEALSSWIKLLIERDIHQFPSVKIDSDLAMKVFSRLALLEEPNNANLSKALRCNARTSQKILDILEILFAVHKLNPHRLGTGKPLYFHCDVSLASYFGADFKKKLWTWAVHEQVSQRSYLGDADTELTYYRNSKGSCIHLVLEDSKAIMPVKILDSERWDLREFEILKAFYKKAGMEKKKISLYALGSDRMGLKNPKIEIFPWESLG